MAIARNKIEKYGVIELNHVSWPETARVFGQLPLDSTDFATLPAENGMWLTYDLAGGSVRFPDALTEQVGVLYMGEKEYNKFEVGLNQYKVDRVGGFLPRIGMPLVGDTYTTNTFCYSDATWASQALVDAALAAYKTTPLYLIPNLAGGAPQLVAAGGLSTATTIAQVVKVYTLPNGEPGIKVQFTKVA